MRKGLREATTITEIRREIRRLIREYGVSAARQILLFRRDLREGKYD